MRRRCASGTGWAVNFLKAPELSPRSCWRAASLICLAALLLSACSPAKTPTTPASTALPPPHFTIPPPQPTPSNQFFVDGSRGSDTNPGTESQPWQTIAMALTVVKAGDIVYVRGGSYTTIHSGWAFSNSGTAQQPISFSNYPGEQVVLHIPSIEKDWPAFGCWVSAHDPPSWQTPRASYIRIVGSDVSPHILDNGITSTKGIVIEGLQHEGAAGIEVGGDCDNWEVAGVDFVDVGYGIFSKKRVFQTLGDWSPDHWYVHDNRVYGFFRESGMQFNGNYNLVENNEIYKVTDQVNTSYGCQMLNLNGNNNIIRGNTLSRLGSQADCLGILLEWDLADANLIENNTIKDVGYAGRGGLTIAGGDNNIIQNNIVYASSPDWYYIYQNGDGSKGWPCNEATADQSDIPPNNPAAEDYAYYYPHTCSSTGNTFVGNVYIHALPGQ